jgi:hypothetical protein
MNGFPDQAATRASEALSIANQLAHPISKSYALFHTGLLHLWRGEEDIVLERAQELLDLAIPHEFQIWIALGHCLYGAGLARTGKAEESVERIQRGLALYQRLNTPSVFWPHLLHVKAEVFGLAGRPAEGLAILEEVEETTGTDTGDPMVAEHLLLKSELILAQSPENQIEAETMLIHGLHIARESGARMSELRVASSLARFWKEQGRTAEGFTLLNESYGKMTEGFNIPDLIKAKALLEELS